MKRRGRFFVFEGGDAVGKATQSKRFFDARCAVWDLLSEDPWEPSEDRPIPPPLLLSFPRYETPVGKIIARHLKGHVALTEEHTIDSSDHNIDCTTVHRKAPEDAMMFQCLMLADKIAANYQIVTQLDAGGDVIADRWWPSGYAYGGSDGLPDNWLLSVTANAPLPVPTVCFFLDLPPGAAVERALLRASKNKDRGTDRYEKLAKQVDVRDRYLQIMSWPLSGLRWEVIDASGTEDEVAARIEAVARGIT